MTRVRAWTENLWQESKPDWNQRKWPQKVRHHWDQCRSFSGGTWACCCCGFWWRRTERRSRRWRKMKLVCDWRGARVASQIHVEMDLQRKGQCFPCKLCKVLPSVCLIWQQQRLFDLAPRKEKQLRQRLWSSNEKQIWFKERKGAKKGGKSEKHWKETPRMTPLNILRRHRWRLNSHWQKWFFTKSNFGESLSLWWGQSFTQRCITKEELWKQTGMGSDWMNDWMSETLQLL